mmetsp:Transcript_28830/g.21469  ORF Transcript_28830/g.21469 Transcript_28830/m.21469 type:complete len:184 (+) Transcript_28830:114-665(+)
MQIISQEVVNSSEQFSHLFPVALYSGRQVLQPGSADYNLNLEGPAQPKIGYEIDSYAYDRLSVDNFGKSYLSKLGWKEGQILGRGNTNSALVDPIEYLPRPAKLGLGARPTDLDLAKLKRKGQTYLDADRSGKVKNYKSIHEELKEREKMKIGSEVVVVSGIHKGMKGRVVGIGESQKTELNQ